MSLIGFILVVLSTSANIVTALIGIISGQGGDHSPFEVCSIPLISHFCINICKICEMIPV